MDDKDLKDLFAAFEPELTSADVFMSRLERRLAEADRNAEMMALLRAENEALRRRNGVAIAVASVAGICVGLLVSLLIPALAREVVAVATALPALSIVVANVNVVAWSAVAATAVVSAMAVYDVALGMIKARE